MFKTRSLVTLLLTLPLVTSSMAAGITRFASASPDAPFSVATQVGNTVYLPVSSLWINKEKWPIT